MLPPPIPVWSKTYIAKERQHLMSHLLIDEKPRFQIDCSGKTKMAKLLSWEYSSIWFKKRDEHFNARLARQAVKIIPNDYTNWLEKRKSKTIFSCQPEGVSKLVSKKSKTMGKKK